MADNFEEKLAQWGGSLASFEMANWAFTDIKPLFTNAAMCDDTSFGYITLPSPAVGEEGEKYAVLEGLVPVRVVCEIKPPGSNTTDQVPLILAKGFVFEINAGQVLMAACVNEERVKIFVHRSYLNVPDPGKYNRTLASILDFRKKHVETLINQYIKANPNADVYYVQDVTSIFLKKVALPTFSTLTEKNRYLADIANDAFEDLKNSLQ